MSTLERPGVPAAALNELARRLDETRVYPDEPLAIHTTYRIGGPADLLYVATTAQELQDAAMSARELGVPCFVLGMGANILVGDRGIRGLVIKNRGQAVQFLGENRVRADSGVVVRDLLEETVARGLSGLEHFAGIPSTVGGALWQNLHFLAPDRKSTLFLGDRVEEARILDEQGMVCTVHRDYFRFGYDDSILHHRQDLVLDVTLRLEPASAQTIEQVIQSNLHWRWQKHPDLVAFPSAGSVFRKAEGYGAGRLIDQCGLKGRVIGRAQVSPKHANFIVNLGGARASDVLSLVDLCQREVRTRFGIELELEIMRVGEF
ncbi:MAG: UDP-N-acetylmuramate dehydrogenase [Chloroflexota bacterium]|nr:MAG: UDP-N-acetylmuramate dehydrogenase [Chloroflexota bacterium]